VGLGFKAGSVVLGLFLFGNTCSAQDLGFKLGDAACNVLTFNACGRERDKQRAEAERTRIEGLRLAAEQARISKIQSLQSQIDIYLNGRDIDLTMFARIYRMRKLVGKTIELTWDEMRSRARMQKNLGDLQRDFKALAKMRVLKDLLISATQKGPDSIYEAYTLIGTSAEGNQLNIEITLKGLLDLTQTTALNSMSEVLVELHNKFLGNLLDMTSARFNASIDKSFALIMEMFRLDATLAQKLLDRQNEQVQELSRISRAKDLPTGAELMSGSLAIIGKK
jgi:hypothetical protein